MFRITKLKLKSDTSKEYEYDFSTGLNYVQGDNATGKTLFYNFFDYMLGDTQTNISQRDGLAGIASATLEFEFDEIVYTIQRFLVEPRCMFSRDGVFQTCSTLEELKGLINDALCPSESSQQVVNSFMNANMTYRTFTLFNFLGEKRLGALNDFFDKSDQTKYRVREAELLNLIFNQNPNLIKEKEDELQNLEQRISRLSALENERVFMIGQINQQLAILKSPVSFTGNNIKEIEKIIYEFEDNDEIIRSEKTRTLSELSFMINSISNQISDLSKRLSESKQIEEENRKRAELLSDLNLLIEGNPLYAPLVHSTKELLKDMSGSISMKDRKIQAETLKHMKAAKVELQQEIILNKKKYTPYSVDEKRAALIIVKNYLSEFSLKSHQENLNDLREKATELRKTIKDLKQTDNMNDINTISEKVTAYYTGAASSSSFVAEDTKKTGLSIRYIKNGNTLQPQFESEEENEGELVKRTVNYNCGSHARQTLIQVCGYCAFMEFLLGKKQYPLIPFLVIDHASKPLDKDSKKAIGSIFKELYQRIAKDNLQIFLFGTEQPDELGLKPEKTIHLVENTKTGFNPFLLR